MSHEEKAPNYITICLNDLSRVDEIARIADALAALSGTGLTRTSGTNELRVITGDTDSPVEKKPVKKPKAAPTSTPAETDDTPSTPPPTDTTPPPAETDDSKDTGSKDTESVSIETLRKVMSEKVGNHRDALKKELQRLGAANITKLDQSKYGEFHEFLINLK